jgi:hypothetical protein
MAKSDPNLNANSVSARQYHFLSEPLPERTHCQHSRHANLNDTKDRGETARAQQEYTCRQTNRWHWMIPAAARFQRITQSAAICLFIG